MCVANFTTEKTLPLFLSNDLNPERLREPFDLRLKGNDDFSRFYKGPHIHMLFSPHQQSSGRLPLGPVTTHNSQRDDA
jgi:hypothetical protein